MRGNRKAILVDIHEKKLDPRVAHRSVDKNGRLSHDHHVVVEEKKVQAKKPEPKKEEIVEVQQEVKEEHVNVVEHVEQPVQDVVESQPEQAAELDDKKSFKKKKKSNQD